MQIAVDAAMAGSLSLAMKDPLQIAALTARRLHYRLWVLFRDREHIPSREGWDEQYRNGRWDYLNGVEESEHYSIIAGYIRQYFQQADVLDVGCGHGRLARILHTDCFSRYIGIDFSEEAIERAKQLQPKNAQFINEDFEKWTPPDSVDVVVFNECLYYSRDPARLVERYAGRVRVTGKVIVSMHESGNREIIWRQLDARLRHVHGVKLRNDRGTEWVVRIYDPPRPEIGS